ATVTNARNRGMQIYASLGATPSWLGGGTPYGQNPPPLSLWGDFCARIVQEFPEVRYWGIWNEPDDPQFLSDPNAYQAILQYARNAIRSVGSTLKVLGPEISVNGIVVGKLVNFMNCCSDLVDIVSVHYYNDGSDPVKWVDQFMDNYVYPVRRGKDVWMT